MRQLFIASFTALFFELLLVRWLPTVLYYLGYYKNCILLAAFLGYGIGCATRYELSRFRWLLPLLVAVLVVAVIAVEHRIAVVPWATGEFLWPQAIEGVKVPMLALLVAAFVVSAVLMLPLGNWVAATLKDLPPLAGYSVNVAGSLAGVATFVALSFMRADPTIWFAVALLPVLWGMHRHRGRFVVGCAGVALAIVVLVAAREGREHWSPYHKITLHDFLPPTNAVLLSTNDNGHQILFDFSKGPAPGVDGLAPHIQALVRGHFHEYESPYSVVRPESVLIIGGGTGNEAAAALRHGISKIHVVEIDPVIVAIGRKYHPERPYDDGRVTVIVDDARHYMAMTAERYDLIIFGALDSTSHLSSLSNIRLDNYVYTTESLERAKQLLTPKGVLQVRYYALAGFVRLRILLMLETVFGRPPLIFELADGRYADIVFFAGSGLGDRSIVELPGLRQMVSLGRYDPEATRSFLTTDDWPYLNVRSRSIGRDHAIGLAAMIAISLVFIASLISRESARGDESCAAIFFLQGVGFMLLETNTITRMALLLGSTWLVTSFAVVLVLLAALVANFMIHRYEGLTESAILPFLVAGLCLNFLVDLRPYLDLSGAARIVLPAIQLYLPILGSSLLFARLFRRTDRPHVHLGVNILGAMVGGMLEYLSIVVGIRAIYLMTLVVFLILWLALLRAPQAKHLELAGGDLSGAPV